ncbi:sulfite oxidase subunit YedZ [Escherichia coli]|uniref:Sulfite oxidase subunit YedZ n=1 Tax=Escherichia coli TaxID=562 RepID=A0A2X3JJA0_ECOLX|nr:sulfite oxidase subunit YedZ [Escherichia coli]
MRLTAKQVTWLKVSLHLAGLLPFPLAGLGDQSR